MNEQALQERFLIPFIRDELGFQEVQANTVDASLIIEADLEAFVSQTELNEKPYRDLLRKYGGNSNELLDDLIALIQERAASSRNMALFLNNNQTVTLQGIRLYLFYTSDSEIHEDRLFEQNIFSVVQELPYKVCFQGNQIFSFRPDVVFFVNGIYLGYSELKSNYTNQSARKNGRQKVVKDYFEAIRAYHQHIGSNGGLTDKEKETARRDLLKIFERAIHITSTDIGETFVIRDIDRYFDDVLETCQAGRFDRQQFEEDAKASFKPYPLLDPGAAQDKQDKLREIFTAHYGRYFLEKEILYYNFIEREMIEVGGEKQIKDSRAAQLISPRPKQKFGTDKILAKIDEFLAHEGDDDYFLKLLERQLLGVSPAKKQELLEKRRKYANNKHVYSLLMQYAAGFGKSNIIGWSALQLKDLRRNGEYVYDKVMIVVDRLQLRDQIDSKMHNMNISRSMFVEARNKTTFLKALASDVRIVIVNLQKFGHVKEMLDSEVLDRLATMRIVFLIDEIHRSNSGDQHDAMISVFDELQEPFKADQYSQKRQKKNLIIGFTATPDDNALARFGEYSGYAEHEKLWTPFDSYTMKDAIEDGYILNPIGNIVPIASRMIFDLPVNKTKGFTQPEYKDATKNQIYENRERIDAIAQYVAELLVKAVYRNIRGTAKAMLAVFSIDAAIAYKDAVTRHFNELVQQSKYRQYADAPILIVYSDNQKEQRASTLNGGMSEEKVLKHFAQEKNGLIIVVDKLQTGFDERRLHTLFLDKEVRAINAIQTISRVNRTMPHKNECKIVDFSHGNVNVQNIKDAFEHFSNVVVSDYDPLADEQVLKQLYGSLRSSRLYRTLFESFMAIYKDPAKRDDPESFLTFESAVERYMDDDPDDAANTKAQAAQYFSILNRLVYVIDQDPKYWEKGFLQFLRKFNQLYNMANKIVDTRDPIDVYFDNQIGITEVEPEEPTPKQKSTPTVATAKAPGSSEYPYSILDIIEARNQQEEQVGILIEEFREKIDQLFEYIRNDHNGKRLIAAMKSDVPAEKIYEHFRTIFRRYKLRNKGTMGERFFEVTEELLETLCDNFEGTVVG